MIKKQNLFKLDKRLIFRKKLKGVIHKILTPSQLYKLRKLEKVDVFIVEKKGLIEKVWTEKSANLFLITQKRFF
jgi:predicted GNAT family N-acyltransferase